MRPELDETLAAPPGEASRTATSPRSPSSGHLAPELAEGVQLGHFRIERRLGAGGMGEVYLATDLALDRPVAVKVLPAAVARDPARRDRLVREARAQARVNHPNIGHIYFIGEEAGRLYFAMEYVAGQTVGDRLAAGPLPVADALSIIRSAALGLREAQRSGITHRDIKPSNLMIDGHGMVKVLDFGLAAGTPGVVGGGPVAQTSLAGTPLYMAPEQARGDGVDFHADIYALGATLFHLVSGRPPFEADSLDALLSKHASAERPALPRRSGTPRTTIAAIDALCARMMAPDPAQRFASYDELIRAIELASVEHARPAGLWARSMAICIDLLLATLVVLPGAGLVEVLTSRHTPDTSALVFAIYAAGAIALTARTGRTPGKWLFELEVVDVVTGAPPTLGRAAIRVLLPILVPLVVGAIKFVVELEGYKLRKIVDALDVVVFLLAPLALLWASLRSVSKQTIWDRLSRTMVRYRTRRTTAI
jgi:uncharacterized RDD family membrane protein YckC